MARGIIFFICVFASTSYSTAFNHLEIRQHEFKDPNFRWHVLGSSESAYYLGFDRFFGEDDDTGVFSGRMSTMPLPPSPILSLSFEL